MRQLLQTLVYITSIMPTTLNAIRALLLNPVLA